jgi:hypothetical protein
MKDRLPQFDMKFIAPLDVGHRAAGLPWICRSTAARSHFLRIADVRFLKPGCGLEKPEMCAAIRRKNRQRDGTE